MTQTLLTEAPIRPTEAPIRPTESLSPTLPPAETVTVSAVRAPNPKPKSRYWRYTLPLAVLLGLGGAGAAYYFTTSASARPDLLWHTTKREPLPVVVVEKGQLESSDNREVICRVKAGTRGTYSTTIKWVIDDGSIVNKGQLIMELDDSALQETYKLQSIVLERAKAEFVKADEEYHITVKQNEADGAKAHADLKMAELDFDKFLGFRQDTALAPLGALVGGGATLSEKGEYRSQLDDVSGRLKQAESDLDAFRERAAWAERSVKLGYLTPSQARVELTKMSGGSDTVEKLRKEKYILETFTRQRTLTDLLAKVDVARMGMEKSQISARSKEVQAENDRRTKQYIYQRELDRLTEVEDQITACKLYAPQSGMVVYTKPESNRYSATSQGLIAQGEQVKEGQKLMRIPDLKRMQVNTKVHEALVAKIRGDDRRSTGVFDSARAALLLSTDPFSRLMSQSEHTLSAVREHFRDREYYIAEKGQRATVRVDALPNLIFNGRVRNVAAVASSLDWGSDVKTYQTLVIIEETVEDLRPDMNAEVTIHIDNSTNPVLTIPIQAVIGGSESGPSRKVMVKTSSGPVEREVTLGKFNDKMIEVKTGLNEGDEVLTNPKAVLGDKIKTREEGADSPKSRGGAPGSDGDKKKGGTGTEKKGGGATKKAGPQA